MLPRLVHVLLAVSLLAAAGLPACRQRPGGPAGEAALVHLADLVPDEAVTGRAPAPHREVRWRFDRPRPEWRPARAPQLAEVELERLADGVRLALRPPARPQGPLLVGGIAVDLEGLRFADWEAVLVRARTRDRVGGLAVAYNLDEEGALPDPMLFVVGASGAPPVFSDGSEQTYAIPLRPRRPRPGGLRSLGVFAGAPGPARVDILSVALVPRGGAFREARGAGAVTRGEATRWT
ncbi:MAG TPA: hypothetical protein VF121_03605, partial [Thermoanaerobaculia bacterium]|nr:hypothetical protein [Thermoanaerobaculia bacterium]